MYCIPKHSLKVLLDLFGAVTIVSLNEKNYLGINLDRAVCGPVMLTLHYLLCTLHNCWLQLSVPQGTLVCVWESFRLRRLRILFSL